MSLSLSLSGYANVNVDVSDDCVDVSRFRYGGPVCRRVRVGKSALASVRSRNAGEWDDGAALDGTWNARARLSLSRAALFFSVTASSATIESDIAANPQVVTAHVLLLPSVSLSRVLTIHPLKASHHSVSQSLVESLSQSLVH